MLITRKGTASNYVFTPKLTAITTEYIDSLHIPPAYDDVTIFYEPDSPPKILFQGYDSKRRLQRIYSKFWVEKKTIEKFKTLVEFSRNIHLIQKRIDERLPNISVNLTKDDCIILTLWLMTFCYFRLGNRRYQQMYGTFGAMNINKSHIKFITRDASSVNAANISFIGKKSVINLCEIDNPQVIRILQLLCVASAPGEMLFSYVSEIRNGNTNNHPSVKTPIRAIDVNAWLKTYHPSMTSKGFRTYDANILLIECLRTPPSHVVSKKKILIQALRHISGKIHNTPAVLKDKYIQSDIIDMFMNRPRKFAKMFLSNNTAREAFENFLTSHYKF